MRKKTQEEVDQFYAEKGYELIGSYEQAHSKIEAKCPNGHTFLSSFAKFKQGRGCPECGEKRRANSRRISESDVRNAFEGRGYSLLSDYRGNLKPLLFKCPEGHEGSMTWASFNRGHGCRKCSFSARGAAKKRNTGTRAISKINAEGYQMLSPYKSAHSLIDLICPEGHSTSISWTNFDGGNRCAHCSKSAPVSTDRVMRDFEEEGYQLLDEYKDNKRRMRFRCPEGHLYSISWSNWVTGHRCGVCSGSVLTHRKVKTLLEKEGYKMLSTYRNNFTPFKFECPQGHIGVMPWANFNSGNRCRYCFKPEVSAGEVRQGFEAEGYTLIDDYSCAEEKLRYICPEGHRHSMIWYSFKQGRRCPECAGKIVRHEDVNNFFETEGYKLLSQYKGSLEYLHYRCPEGHEHKITWGSFKSGNRCAYCAHQMLTPEQIKINKIKKSVNGLVQHHLRKQNVSRHFSKSSFSSKVAVRIFEKLGERPDGTHLDHIIPQVFFDYRNKEEVEACWHIANLRWIPIQENLQKGPRVSRHEIASYSKEQAQILAIASRKPNRLKAILLELWPDCAV
jgi:ribosomal protein S27E